MLLLQNLITALEQLWANKLRSLLTVLGIIIAVMSTLVVVAVVQGFSSYVTTFLQGLGTNSMWVFPEMPDRFGSHPVRAELIQADVAEVEQSCSAIDRLSPLVIRQVKVNYRDREAKMDLQGVSADFQHIRNFFVDTGRCFGDVETDNRRQVCVLGREALKNLHADEGIVGGHVTLEGKRFRVIGLLEKK